MAYAQKAGLHEVPIVVIEADDKSFEFGIVENVQRHDLNAIEEAEGYKRLIDEFSWIRTSCKIHRQKQESYCNS